MRNGNRTFSAVDCIENLTAAGFTPEQARAQAKEFENSRGDLMAVLATKQDIAETKRDIAELRKATKHDLEFAKLELKHDIKELDAKIETIRAELKQDIEVVRAELKQDIEQLRSDTQQSIKTLELKIENRGQKTTIWLGGAIVGSATFIIGAILLMARLGVFA